MQDEQTQVSEPATGTPIAPEPSTGTPTAPETSTDAADSSNA